MSNRNFYMVLVGITALMFSASYYPITTWLKPGSLPFIYVAIGLSAVSSLVAYSIVSGGLSQRITLFTTYIVGSMLAKMMIGIMSITIVALKFKPYSSEYVLSYFFCYFIFTGFEVYALMRKLRPISKNGRRDLYDEKPNT